MKKLASYKGTHNHAEDLENTALFQVARSKGYFHPLTVTRSTISHESCWKMSRMPWRDTLGSMIDGLLASKQSLIQVTL